MGGIQRYKDTKIQRYKQSNFQRSQNQGVRDLDLDLDDPFPSEASSCMYILLFSLAIMSEIWTTIMNHQCLTLTDKECVRCKDGSCPKKNEWVEGKQQMVSSHELFAPNANQTYLINESTVSLLCVYFAAPFSEVDTSSHGRDCVILSLLVFAFTSFLYKLCRKKLTV